MGLEDGTISLWTVSTVCPAFSVSLLYRLPDTLCHAAAVRRLAWKPITKDAGDSAELVLASCSDDCTVRVFACANPYAS